MATSSQRSNMDQHRPPILTITKAPDAGATPPSSPPDRKFKPIRKVSSLETVKENDLTRTQPQYAACPPNAQKPAARGQSPSLHSRETGHLAEKPRQYVHDALHERSANSAVASVRSEALIYAELKTNIKIENEQHFLTTFANHLAARYNRHPSSTVVSLHHSQSLLFSGSPNPAYILTVTALACEVQPATNKRNAAVLQKHLEAILRVPPARGMVRFVPVAEECLAWGGKTVTGRISEALARLGEENKLQEKRRLKVIR
ncbi:Tautomerase/MIF [Trichoderma gracile]